MSGDPIAFARHDLLVVAPADWEAVTATRASALAGEAADLVARWGAAGWPVIARRASAGDGPAGVPVGLPLPPSLGKARVALAIPTGVERRRRDGVSLREARPAASVEWHPAIDAALALGASLGFVPRVYGALLWQSLTGLDYLHPGSDLDLLWPVATVADIDCLLDGLARLDSAAPMRLDGEIRTSHGDVAWRELAAARRGEAEIVLAKSLARTGFVAASTLFARETAPCS